MAKKLAGKLKLQVAAGQANPAPPVGPAGSAGIYSGACPAGRSGRTRGVPLASALIFS